MTLTLEEVRNVRFPMAKRPNEGYRATEVDNFVDKVEVAFEVLENDNNRMRSEIEALHEADAVIEGQADSAEVDGLRSQVEQLQNQLNEVAAQAQAREEEIGRLRGELESVGSQAIAQGVVSDEERAGLQGEINRLGEENAGLRNELDGVRGELDNARGELAGAQQESAALREDLERANAELQFAAQGTGYVPVIRDGVEYIEVTTSAEAGTAVARMVALSVEQAEMVTREAREESDSILAKANTEAHELTTSAQSRADQIVGEAQIRADRMTSEAQTKANETTRASQEEADRVTSEAQAHANKLFQDTEDKRRELFTALEEERDVLAGKVEQLRNFEAEYRSGLQAHLSAQIERLNKAEFEPAEQPEILDEMAEASDTPRLDALLHEDQQ